MLRTPLRWLQAHSATARAFRAAIDQRRAEAGERGYVLVFVTIGMTVILAFVAFTVDYGSWYNRSAQIKRAADAAALAGVVWMPEFDVAESAALAAAARNGFVDGVDDISIDVEAVVGNNRQLEVSIRDNEADQYFSRVVINNQSIGRTSLAEYVMPVPLGSPKNTFGTGDLLGSADRENFWAAVSGYCSGHESGDKKLSFWESYSNSGTTSACNNSSDESTDYDPEGYLYAIKLPANASSLKLEMYDAPYFRSGSNSDNGLATNQTITTIVEVYDRNPTPLDLTSLPLLQTYTFTTNQAQLSGVNLQNNWVRLRTWTNPQAGEYYLRVKTSAAETTGSRGSNGFGIRAFTGSSFSTCTSIVGSTGYSATCPQVYGVSDMSIYVNGESATASFYLAQIDPVHAGKTMRITLFDSGEGASSLRILDPNGTARAFTWSTFCNPPTPPSGSCSGTSTGTPPALDVSGTGTQPFTGLNSSSKYNDRSMIIDIPLPANYTTLFGTKTWWKVQYVAGSNPTDRTTWSVNIVGDPVHLID
jgi:hypothetical protein